ncbi:MAG TPA: hypothetical protein VLM11_11175 [Streptosporangiaceae bacterium]|nr:hypothetical protein [Streptosporangiaceae bacterium]
MNRSNRLIAGWFLLLVGAGVALLIVWLARVVSVPLATFLTAGAVIIALSWLIVLTTVPWNLYFGARRAAQEMAVSRERGIAIRTSYDEEAGRISRRMLRFALSAHVGTAAAAAAVAFFSGNEIGYYIAGVSLLSTTFRPAAAYFVHVRERIKVLTRETTHPRDDVATLLHKAEVIEESVDDLRIDLRTVNEDLRRTESRLADGIAHAREILTADLNRLQDAQATDLVAARSRDEDLERRIDQMARSIEATLDGISDHQELLTGLRALVRMVRSDSARGSEP